MEQEVEDKDIFDEQIQEADLEEEADYDFDEDPLDLFADVEEVTEDDIDEVEQFSPSDAVRLRSLKTGSDALDTYIKHQQGAGGYNQIMSGNISQQVLSNMRNNLPSNLRRVPNEALRDTFLGYWRHKLGNTQLSASDKDYEGIVRAAKESGENPDKWLRIAQVESNFNPNAISPSGRHQGYFQVDKSYVSNQKLLSDPYYATKIAIRHNRNQFQNGKLDYQLGGFNPTINMQPISSLGYSPVGGIPYSNNDSWFGGAKVNNGLSGLSSLDPTGTSQLVSKIDTQGANIVNGINNGIQAYKSVKDVVGRTTDTAITGISTILEERRNQRDYLNMVKRLYGEGNYVDSVDSQVKQKESFI